MKPSIGTGLYRSILGLPVLKMNAIDALGMKALNHVLDIDTAVADNSELQSRPQMMTAIEYWFLRWTSRCLSMAAGHLVVAGRKIGIAEEEGD